MRTSGFSNRQQTSGMPFGKYRPFLETNPVSLPDRTWPGNRITKAPRWLSTDLRDGNQALIEPMDPARKRAMFDLLVKIGFKEIEIGFPSASQTDFDFVRSLIEDDAAPEDVTVSVLTQSRSDLIGKTIESIKGFPRATVHIYNATAPVFRDIVFHNDKPQTVELAVAGTREVVAQAEKILDDETIFGLEYSPEIFVDTELDFALEVCEAVMDVWQPSSEREIILNLPTTVERCTPNIYADQIEYFSRNISRREFVCISAHNHNDRGTGIATAELAQMAGADRVEGCLLGQGERTGNVDLVTLALNLFSQGIDPQLDLSNLDEVRDTVEHCTRMSTPQRLPYVGELVYTSFSGSHQDAIKKGFAAREEKVKAAGGDENAVIWELPYLPIDPHDVGRNYEAVVRVNSQSGKGGVAYLMKEKHHLDLPRRLQIEFSRIVQKTTDKFGGELTADNLWKIFADEYLPASEAGIDGKHWGRFFLDGAHVSSVPTAEGGDTEVSISLNDRGAKVQMESVGNGPVDAFVHAFEKMGLEVRILDYVEHAMSAGRDASAAAYVEAVVDGEVLWGVGIDPSTIRAAYKAVISAINRAQR
ncbi:MAG: 2-isopropylmalate synthase [Mobiluncus porci]|uniref:2-isopropylmalate synthase n=1 Tax=Mobiluncus porci TaxID=2652278 RepID=UPI0023F33E3F|nr:2-isopropylmalate synthase [Mobiluncus porci]MDD7540825.1 2-isopropylmalate synthase [Mobiluncus porci]MDY5749189.1 2-isopropylmalate synthase [Mobiluncus porci]